MYFCVFLVVPKINLLVPAKWIFHLNVYSLVNNGVCTFEQHLIFYSNEDKPPNFLAPIRNNFDKTEDACYYANIVKVFDDNDTIAEKYVEGRRRIVPVYYKDPVKCLLSYEYEPRCDDSGSLPDTSAKEDILLLQKMICFLQEKFHDAAFDAQEKRAIQTIIIDDDAVEMQILLPTPKMEMEVKEEPGETAVEAISSTVTPENVNHVTDGHIQFQVNANGDRIFNNGFVLTADRFAELARYNTTYPMTTSLYDEWYIKKLIGYADIRREDMKKLLRDIFEFRAEGDMERMARFDRLLKSIIEDGSDDD